MPTISAPIFEKGVTKTVNVNVTGNFAFSKQDAQLIVETAIGYRELHQTTKAKGNTTGGIGYIHNYSDNTLWLVGAIGKSNGVPTITILRSGQAKNNVHQFK